MDERQRILYCKKTFGTKYCFLKKVLTILDGFWKIDVPSCFIRTRSNQQGSVGCHPGNVACRLNPPRFRVGWGAPEFTPVEIVEDPIRWATIPEAGIHHSKENI